MKGKIFSEIQFNLIVSGNKNSFWESIKKASDFNHQSKYKVDEILYLKEPYREDRKDNKIYYRYNSENTREIKDSVPQEKIVSPGLWKNKLYMPQRYARYFIRITGIKKDLLENVYCEDCIREGLPENKCHKHIVINKSGNKMVWIYEFVLMESLE